MVLFSAVIAVSLLSRRIINQITEGQDELAVMFSKYRPEKRDKIKPYQTKLSFVRSYVGIFMILSSSAIAGYFIDYYAPEVFIDPNAFMVPH